MQETAKLKNRIIKIIIFAVAVCVIAGAAIADAVYRNRTALYTDTFISMGSAVTEKVYGVKGQLAVQSVCEGIKDLDLHYLSNTRAGSYLWRINEGAGKYPVETDAEFADYLKKCIEIAQGTNGAFNPAFGAVIDIWDIDGENPRVPEDGLLERKLALCDYNDIEIDGNSVYLKKEGMKLHFGAAGKGIACDRALCELLEYSNGVYGAVISVGGSVMTYGENPSGKLWTVAIRNPNGALNDTIAEIKTQGTKFFSTSGNYEKYFEKDGERYGHIFDTKTGRPVKSTLSSVTVVADSGLCADALSTACFALGEEESIGILKKYGCQAVFVYENSKIRITEGLSDSFTLTCSDYECEIIKAAE